MKLESQKMLALCTSHLSYATVTMMEEHCSDIWNLNKYTFPVMYEKGEYGFFVPVLPLDEAETERRRHYPRDLDSCLDFARTNGFDWIMFDRDVEPISGLPTYGW